MTRGLFKDTDIKATIYCSIIVIMFLFFYKGTELNFFIERVLTLKYFAAIGRTII